MHIKKEFAVGDLEVARSIVKAHPFATIVTAGLRATHMPCLIDERSEGLAILSHAARADPVADDLDGPMLAIFQGPSGYISAGWYASATIPTWNHITLHVRGVPQLFDDAMPVLQQTVEHFESALEEPWVLESMGETAREMADEVIAFRLTASSWHAEAKLSQDKPVQERSRVLAGLECEGPYANAALASAMRGFGP